MENRAPARHFLGANSRYGFYSLYHHISHPEKGEFLYIIKGGPGCGKSSFMRCIGAAAEKCGENVEYILCSGDPDSLDGLILPDRGIAFVDGTAPHAIEAAYPGCSASYIDLGRFYDSSILRGRVGEIIDINRRYKTLYSTAYSHIASAAAILPRCCGLTSEADIARIRKKAESFARRELPESAAPAAAAHRFISSFGCKGAVMLPCPAGKVLLADNMLGLGNIYIETLAQYCLARGLESLLYHDCLDPERLCGIYVPEADLAVLSPEPGMDYPGCVYRHIHLDLTADCEEIRLQKTELRRSRKLAASILDSAAESLARAKSLHDELEAIYNPYVDFSGVYSEAEKYIKALGL